MTSSKKGFQDFLLTLKPQGGGTLSSETLVCYTSTQICNLRAKWTQNLLIWYSKSSQLLQKRLKDLCFGFERFPSENLRDFL